MDNLFVHIPSRIIFGSDCIGELGSLASEFGQRALMVTEAAPYNAKVLTGAIESLSAKGIQAIVFQDISLGFPSASVDDAVSLVRTGRAQMIVGVGGIRALSFAKCIASLASGGTVYESMAGILPGAQALPYIEVPSACRNPFMFRDAFLMVDGRTKHTRIGRTQPLITKAVLLDPKLSNTLSERYVSFIVFDCLLSAIEGIVSAKSNFMAQPLLLEACRLIFEALKLAMQKGDPSLVRTLGSKAGLLCALGLSVSSQGMGSALAYALAGHANISKSAVSATLLPYVIEHHSAGDAGKVCAAAKAVGIGTPSSGEHEICQEFVQAVRSMMGLLNVPGRLRDLELRMEDMASVRDIALSLPFSGSSSSPMTKESLFELIKTAF